MSAAFLRVDHFLRAAPVVEALLARLAAERPEPDDPETANLLAEELLSFRSSDGSWGGSLLRSAESLLLLGELLGRRARDERCNTSVAWLLQQRDQPGRFAEACDQRTHQLEICSHYFTGFFSPGPRSVTLANTTLDNGLVLVSEEDARLACSAQALRAVLRWGGFLPELAVQVRALEKLGAMAFRPVYKPVLGAAAFLEVVAALVAVPPTTERSAIVQSAINRLAALQRADGSWPDLEAIHAADLLLCALTRGYSSPVLESALLRSAELLVLTQHENGSWSNAPDPQRTYIGWRVLRHIALSEKVITRS